MLIDARTLPPRTTLDADVGIIGAGPAGITLARELAAASRSVCVLESGGFDLDEAVQALCEGEAHSRHHAPDAMSLGRRRQFGGTANLWVHRTTPWDRRLRARILPGRTIDFEPRDGLEYSCWPVDRSALDPFYERAQAAMQLGPYAYDANAWVRPGAEPFPLPGEGVENTVCHYAAKDVFSHRYRDDLARSGNITIVLNATSVGLGVTGPGRAVRTVRATSFGGPELAVRAQTFVLAGGGLENARMLLAAETHPGTPLGDGDGPLGRFLCEHPEFRLGVIVPPSPEVFDRAGFYDIRWAGTSMVSGTMALTQETMRREGLLSMGVILVPQPRGYGSSAERALKELTAVRRRERPDRFLRSLGSVAANPGDAVAVARARLGRRADAYSEFRGGWSGLTDNASRFRVFAVTVVTEQVPNPDNRVSLSGQRDHLGVPQLRMDWRWGDREAHSIDRATAILARDLARAGIGEFLPWTALEGGARPVFGGLHHPMGTTRMHPDPALGVVDADCRVHGVDNLFVAGSSVFPTGLGHANPTLTILALALRLADHISPTRRGQLCQEPD